MNVRGRIGKMRDRVLVQSPVHTVNDIGGRTTSWTTVGTYWAEVTDKTGSRSLDSNSYQFNHPVEIVFHFYDVPTIKSTWRLTIGTDVYTIVTIVKEESEGFIYIMADRRES